MPRILFAYRIIYLLVIYYYHGIAASRICCPGSSYITTVHFSCTSLLDLSASQARRILLLWHCCLPVCLPFGLVCRSSQLYRRMHSAYLYLGYSLSYHMCVRIHIRRYRRIHRIRMSLSAYSYNYIIFGVFVAIYIWRISLFQRIRLFIDASWACFDHS